MNARSSIPSLLITALLLASLAPLSSVAAVPTEASEFYYGVEYDWSSVDTDLENFTGLDIPEILGEVMGAADDAGFNLIIGQLQTGSSNVYVHHTEDIAPQTIQDNNGNDVSVWSRTDDVTLRHGILADSILQTDWSEKTFGSDETSFDIDVVQSLEQVLTVDMTYTEYLDDSSNLIGADMEFSMDVSADIGLNIDALFEGGGDDFPVDFDAELTIGYSITDSTSQWRLGSPDPVYVELSSNDEYEWECGESECGDLTGDYTGAVDYSFSIEGIPTEDFGLDAGEFDLEISDSLTDSGNFDMEMYGEWDFSMGETLTVDLGDGDGVSTQVQSCEDCPPGNPLMFMMMAYVLAGSGEAFAEQIGEDLGEGITDGIEDWFGVGGSAETDGMVNYYSFYAYESSNDEDLALIQMNQGTDINWDTVSLTVVVDNGYPTTCVNPGSIDITVECSLETGSSDDYWRVGDTVRIVDNADLCPAGEYCSITIHITDVANSVLLSVDYLYVEGQSPAGSIGMLKGELHSWGEQITMQSSVVGGTPFVTGDFANFGCDDGTIIDWDEVSDGNNDCSNGEDEANLDGSAKWFTCNDGSEIDWQQLNDYFADCTTAEDEGIKHHYTLQMTLYDEMGAPLYSIEKTICEANCDSNPDWDSDWSEETGVSMPSEYGETTMCMDAMISETGASSPLLELDQMCEFFWIGPEIGSIYLRTDGLDFVEYDAYMYDYSNADDATATLTLKDPNQNSIITETIDINGSSSYYELSGSTSVLEEGEYCLHVELIQDGEATPYTSETVCEMIEAIEEDVSERVETVFSAIIDSGLQDVLEQFGMNLEDRLETVEPFEEFPYDDFKWAPLWSNEHAAIVGVGVYVMNDNGTYTMAGPTTQGYTDEAPAKLSIRYLTGLAANTATNGMEEATNIDDIVDVEDHNLDDIAEDLAEAGIDVSNLTLPEDNPTDGTTNDDNPTPPTAEELAEDAGALPFLSPVSMVAVIVLAGVVAGSRRDENQDEDA
ncbi:MAG: hypothetical protein CL926_01250 [Deltaproteobacteria bacterium]|nr:hypothetical protein [Deltaproteobacteria bacterium]